MRFLFALVFLWAALVSKGIASNTVLTEGRKMSDAFLRRDLTPIWEAMTPQMQDEIGNLEALSKFRDDVEHDFGSESEVLEEEVKNQGSRDIYLRTARWTQSTAPVLTQWMFDREQKISGFFVRQAPAAAETRFLDYQTKATLQLPFEGDWFVFWGGRTLEQNYHVADKAQRFATDFVIRRNGATRSGDAADLDSYFCWGRLILAPAHGTVVAAIDGLPDQEIGQSDPKNPAGNHVVLDLGNGEFAFLAHLRQGSVAVSRGEKVADGQEVGRCGNSGNSSEPHLHVHLQTTPDLGAGEGLPAFFENYLADGRPVERGEPGQGQTVSPRA